jgi:hypothetical protein
MMNFKLHSYNVFYEFNIRYYNSRPSKQNIIILVNNICTIKEGKSLTTITMNNGEVIEVDNYEFRKFCDWLIDE